MTCRNCTCPLCRRDTIAHLVREAGQVDAAKLLGVSQSTISRWLNRKVEAPASAKEVARRLLILRGIES